ncbi:MAG: hypothetical protein JO038_05775 [Alphaproteobacteria bacterium]|nr:hypothetical protein [Alphaproteobacteria bacterium]
MSPFVPHSIRSPCEFDIAPDRSGHWLARDRNGLVGGVFVTREAALHFALFEAGGDASRIHEPEAEPRPCGR